MIVPLFRTAWGSALAEALEVCALWLAEVCPTAPIVRIPATAPIQYFLNVIVCFYSWF
jgi:hypothetical protein